MHSVVGHHLLVHDGGLDGLNGYGNGTRLVCFPPPWWSAKASCDTKKCISKAKLYVQFYHAIL